ncbi:MAG: DUF3667 domain-containing protein [Maricaulaceae bacterium]
MEPADKNSDIEHIAPLEADNIPNYNQAHYCFSCDEPILGAFCMACGQKNDNFRRGIFSLIWELISSITAIEGRIWRTWRSMLFQPGRVAREYANGRRIHWSSPIRVYLAMSILLFAFMGITKTHLFGIDVNVTPEDGIEVTETAPNAEDLDIKFSTFWFPRQKDIDARNADKNFKLIQIKLNSYKDALDNPNILIVNPEDDPVLSPNEQEKVKVAKEEIADATEGESLKIDDFNIEINNRKVDSTKAIEQFIRFTRNPVEATNSFNKWLPRLIFIMMPFTVLFSALFIRGHENAMLYDHLIHAAYIHAVAFFFLLLGVALSPVIASSWLFNILIILLLIYLPLSLKRMFNRGWLKTIWTSYGVGLFYLFFLIIGLSIAIIVELGKTITV